MGIFTSKKSSMYYVVTRYEIRSTGKYGYRSAYFFQKKLTVKFLDRIFDMILMFLKEDGVAGETDTRETVKMFITNMIKLED